MIILYLDNGTMSLMIQLFTLLTVVVYSCSMKPQKAFNYGFYMMLAASVVGELIIAGAGISFILSLLLYPVTGGIIGFAVSVVYKRLKKTMGFSLNVSHDEL